jgi:hypothetical protein
VTDPVGGLASALGDDPDAPTLLVKHAATGQPLVRHDNLHRALYHIPEILLGVLLQTQSNPNSLRALATVRFENPQGKVDRGSLDRERKKQQSKEGTLSA